MRYAVDKHKNKAFTLVELLIVIALLAILSGVVVLVMNPSELIKEGRDATRAADLASLTTSISLLQADNPIAFMGTSSIIYVSIPDTDSNCASLGLPPLSPPWTYTCADPLTYRRANGTGWIPVDFTSFSAGSPLSKLPVDPVNTTSTGEHYTYTAGSFKPTALFESVKKANAMGKDGGLDPARYETGDKPDLPIPINGLVGYWKMDETSGSLADSSGTGNIGVASGGIAYNQPGKVDSAIGLNGVNGSVNSGNATILNITNNITIGAWIKPAVVNIVDQGLVEKRHTNSSTPYSWRLSQNRLRYEYHDGIAWRGYSSNPVVTANEWQYASVVFSPASALITFYRNGVAIGSFSTTGIPQANGLNLIIGWDPGYTYFNGFIDDVRIYNRALSAQEIRTIYEATK